MQQVTRAYKANTALVWCEKYNVFIINNFNKMSTPAQENANDQTMMIWNMESKLNKSWFSRYNRKTDTYAKLSINQYWDWLIYIDVSSLQSPLITIVLNRTITWPSSRS